jgi:hypothetical protein
VTAHPQRRPDGEGGREREAEREGRLDAHRGGSARRIARMHHRLRAADAVVVA